MVETYAGVDRDGSTTQGGCPTHVVADADFVLSVPAGLDLATAAPLLCAGITTCSPLRRWGASPGRRVAVVGLGGLGHMAVEPAHAMGAEITVLSQSLEKQEDGLRLGADHLHATSDPWGDRSARRSAMVHRDQPVGRPRPTCVWSSRGRATDAHATRARADEDGGAADTDGRAPALWWGRVVARVRALTAERTR